MEHIFLRSVILPIVFCVSLMIYSAWNFIRRYHILKNKLVVEAKLIRIREKNSGEGGTEYYPTFSYIVDGIEYETEYKYSIHSTGYTVGTSVTLYHHRKNPKKIELPERVKRRMYLDIYSFVVGVAIIILVLYVWNRR